MILTWTGGPDPDAGTPISYTINRSVTSGTRYTFLTTLTIPRYTDTGVSNGVTYYYTVSANIGACASAASAEVSAKPSP